jgi:hypothetical protein
MRIHNQAINILGPLSPYFTILHSEKLCFYFLSADPDPIRIQGPDNQKLEKKLLLKKKKKFFSKQQFTYP